MTYVARSETFEAFLLRLNETVAMGMGEAAPPEVPWLTGQIVGLPRSGTTVLYQLLARTRLVGYPSNVMALFWQAPTVGAQLHRHFSRAVPTLSTRSIAGRTPEPMDPHEFGYFWRSVLGHSANSVTQDLTPWTWDRLQRTLDAVTGVFEAPVVYKNFLVLRHISDLRQHLTGQRYLALRRPLVDIGASLLTVRRAIGIPDEADFGLATSHQACDELQTVLHRVAQQVTALDALMVAGDFDQTPDSVVIDYTDLCADPRGTVERLLHALDIDDADGALASLPVRLDPGAGAASLDRGERATLERLIEEMHHG